MGREALATFDRTWNTTQLLLFRTVSIILFATHSQGLTLVNTLLILRWLAGALLKFKIKQTTNCKYNFRSPDDVSKLIRFEARYFD